MPSLLLLVIEETVEVLLIGCASSGESIIAVDWLVVDRSSEFCFVR